MIVFPTDLVLGVAVTVVLDVEVYVEQAGRMHEQAVLNILGATLVTWLKRDACWPVGIPSAELRGCFASSTILLSSVLSLSVAVGRDA